MSATSLTAWVGKEIEGGAEPREIAAACAMELARRKGLNLDQGPMLVRSAWAEKPCNLPVDIKLTPWSLGFAYEQALDATYRHRHGVYYTPRRVASRLAEIALDGRLGRMCEIVDPAVGGGAFLLAAAQIFADSGFDRNVIVSNLLWGIDIDPISVEVSVAALALWGSDSSGGWVTPEGHIVEADTLTQGAAAFKARSQGFEVVLGNPPFQGQLVRQTARSTSYGRFLRTRWDTKAGRYTDTAAFFLLASIELSSPSGRVVLVQPQSVLGAADAAPIRKKLEDDAALTGLWFAGSGVFDAGVRVCAPVLDLGVAPGPVRRWTGEAVQAADEATCAPSASSWSPLVADLLGAPSIEIRSNSTVGDVSSATAGFRDEFYGLAKCTFEEGAGSSDGLPLITAGMIDPFRNRRGTASFRFANRRWRSPVVDASALQTENTRLFRWVDQLSKPKLLVATQTKVVEVVVDPVGDLVASTPVIAVVPSAGLLWHLAAALSSPVISAIAFERTVGTAMSGNAIKLSAREVLMLPLPQPGEQWDKGAHLARAASAASTESEWVAALDGLGLAMCLAYGLTENACEVLNWWKGRRPHWR